MTSYFQSVSEKPDIAAMSLDSDIYGHDDDYDGTYDPDWSCQTCGSKPPQP